MGVPPPVQLTANVVAAEAAQVVKEVNAVSKMANEAAQVAEEEIAKAAAL
jgi:hypothetical protein